MEENSSVPSARGERGGWITFPFIIGSMGLLQLAAGGWISNLIVYLIEEFNMKSISAAKIYNVVNGSITMFPIVGAVIADSYAGCFSVIWFSSLISQLGIFLLLLTASTNNLRPPPCPTGSNRCQYPSHLEFAILYLGLALSSLGNAGTRFTIAPMGADQFENPKHQGIFFNWYIFTMYTATVISSTAIVYVEDNVSWAVGFSLCAAANLVGIAVFVCGKRLYRLVKPKGSPFTNLWRVVVGAVRKRRMILSDRSEDYYHRDGVGMTAKNPTLFFRFLNRAALRTTEPHTHPSTSIANPWKNHYQCTVEQVEDLKTLIKLFPLWSTGFFLCTPLAIQLSLSIIQALAMDRKLGPAFTVPAGSMPVFILISTSISILIIDRVLFPLWEKLGRKPLTLLQRVGIGHFLTVVSMAVSAVVESRRLRSGRGGAKTSAFWLVPQLAIAGLGEAFHFPGQIALYYQEFPEALKSTSTAAVAMFIGTAFYISNGVIDLVQRATGWLPDDIDEGRLDNVYWLCCAVGVLNFGYFVVCSWLYKYQGGGKCEDACDKS